MFDKRNGIHICDFCEHELYRIFIIYDNDGGETECCFSCQQHRKHNDAIYRHNGKYYWR